MAMTTSKKSDHTPCGMFSMVFRGYRKNDPIRLDETVAAEVYNGTDGSVSRDDEKEPSAIENEKSIQCAKTATASANVGQR